MTANPQENSKKIDLNCIFKLPGISLGIIAITGLIILMWYSAVKGEEIYQNKLHQITNPDQFAGRIICLSFAKIEKVAENNAIARDSREVIYHLAFDGKSDFIEGGTYSLTGYLNSEGYIQVESVQVHRNRRLKYLFSGLSVIIVIFLAVKYLRFDRNGIFLIKAKEFH